MIFILFSSCGRNHSQTERHCMKYEFLPITRTKYNIEQVYSAQIKGSQDIRLMPKVEGYLRDVYINDGDRVKKGQILFVIDQTNYKESVVSARASVFQAEALLSKVKQDHEGKRILNEKNIISEFELTQSQKDVKVAEANLEVVKAQLEMAINSLSFTEIKSPSDGVVGQIHYHKGDFVGPNIQQCLTIVSDDHQMDVCFSLSESVIMDYMTRYKTMEEAIKNMPELKLMLPGKTIYPHKGKVKSVSGVIDEQTGTVAVKATFPNKEGMLLSGGSAKVIMEQSYSDVFVIPQEATFEILDKIYVFKVVDGKAKSMLINVERQNNGKNYVVTGGLEEGDTIVASGASFLHENDNLK